MCKIITGRGAEVSYQDVIEACNDNHFTMSLAGDDASIVMDVVNQGIDAHLEACYLPDKGDAYNMSEGRYITRLECVVSPESLCVLVRRLYEYDNENSHDLANEILMSLGVYVG